MCVLVVGCAGETKDGGGHTVGGRGGVESSAAGKGGAGQSGATAGAGTGNIAAGTGGASAGTAGAFGGAGGGGGAGASGAPHTSGGAGGRTPSAGAGGTEPSDAGTSNRAGSPNAAGEGGAPSDGGMPGDSGEGGAPAEPAGLSWPVDCIPGATCVSVGYPDIDGDGVAHDCGAPAYVGHEGTDINITPEAEAAGTAVRAAADGVVVFAFDGKFDQCPNASEPDCQEPSSTSPGSKNGTTVCTPLGPYCGRGGGSCYWCFAGGNVIVVRHTGVPGVFATRYDHLKKSSVLVAPGDTVTRGQKIAEAASAGNSTAPHLHFEVWGTGFYELADPWAGPCGPNTGPSLWAYDPPWSH